MSFGLKYFLVCACMNLLILFFIGAILDAFAAPIVNESHGQVVATTPTSTGASTGRLTNEAVEYIVNFKEFPPWIYRDTGMVQVEVRRRPSSGQKSPISLFVKDSESLLITPVTFDN